MRRLGLLLIVYMISFSALVIECLAQSQTLYVGMQVRLYRVLGCSTLELAATIFDTHASKGHDEYLKLRKSYAKDPQRPAKPYCYALHGEDFVIMETAQLTGTLNYPKGEQYVEVVRVKRLADGLELWAFFTNLTILKHNEEDGAKRGA